MASKKRQQQKRTPNRPDGPYGRKTTINDINLNIDLTEEQGLAYKLAMDNKVVVLRGRPGTAKTTMNCYIALQCLLSRRVGKIYVTRPNEGIGKTTGLLPGEAYSFHEGKMAPYLKPVLSALYELHGKVAVDKLIEIGKIEVQPLEFIRGSNIKDAVIIIDESQNCTPEELKAITTRLCKDAKMLFSVDTNQIDLRNKKNSAGWYFDNIADLKGVEIIELKENFRDELALAIMDRIDEQLSKEAENKK